MSKSTRQQKKEEEEKILSEMREALRENERTNDGKADNGKADEANDTGKESASRRHSFYDPTPERIHCRRCKTLMENGVCPTCGFRMYVPMDDKKKGKIKFVLTCVFMAAFVIAFVIIQITKS